MKSKYLSVLVLAIILVFVANYLKEPLQTENEKYIIDLKELEEENEYYRRVVSRLEGEVQQLLGHNKEVAQAIVTLESYLLSKDIVEAMPYFAKEVSFPADDDPDSNPHQINFPSNYMFEWTPNKVEKQELSTFSRNSDQIILLYRTTVHAEDDYMYEYTMVMEDSEWKISKINTQDYFVLH